MELSFDGHGATELGLNIYVSFLLLTDFAVDRVLLYQFTGLDPTINLSLVNSSFPLFSLQIRFPLVQGK